METAMRVLLMALLLVPAPVWAAESTPGEAVSALWKALSHEPGKGTDAARLARLFHQDAVIFGGSYKDGVPAMKRTFAEKFLVPQGKAQQDGFYECEVFRTIETYDRFATVYSVVESRTSKAAASPDAVGVNSIQLYKVGAEWKILSLYYHLEQDGNPVPLDKGISGKCIA
jgi:hypothetical protein